MDLAEGLEYERFRYHDSWVYMLTVDLSKREIRPVMAAEQFPFQGKQPAIEAIEEGALGCVAGGYNITVGHHLGVTDEPQHALMLDREIWTTGIGAGGYGVLIGDGTLRTQKNRIEIHVWRPDHTAIEVEHVNRGHEGDVVAFTRRGGANEYPRGHGKFFVSLRGDPLVVDKVARIPTFVWPRATVLESTYDLGLAVGDEVKWTQRIGGDDVHTIVSGWPELLHDGELSDFDELLHPESSAGPDNWLTRVNPRTMVGSSKNGRTAYLISVQGRTEESVGLRLKELATFAQRHGAHYGVNMDGGGSVFMWVKNHDPQLVAKGCYNTEGTMEGGRPAHFSVSVF